VILDEVATITRVLGIAEGAVGVSGAVHGGAAEDARERMQKLERMIRKANELAARVGEATLTVPGEKPIVDLRPWWSRVLEKVSATARRNTAAQQLETLRLEADAALLRSVGRA
jgi:gamma-glutamyl:cysteine ligase YbdK (ATP-grasp superfamily)